MRESELGVCVRVRAWQLLPVTQACGATLRGSSVNNTSPTDLQAELRSRSRETCHMTQDPLSAEAIKLRSMFEAPFSR